MELENNKTASKFKFFSFKIIFTLGNTLKAGAGVIRQKNVNAFHREIAKVTAATSLGCVEDNLLISEWREITEEEFEYFNDFSIEKYRKSEKESEKDNILHYNVLSILSTPKK